MRKPPTYTGVVRIWHALFYSLSGLRHALREESAFQQELILVAVLTPLACLLPVSSALLLAVISAHFLVLIVELLNTAIETVVDRVSPDFHDLAKQAKDMGSAAVFLSLVYLGIAWAVALYESIRAHA